MTLNPVQLIRSPAEITAPWMTEVLRANAGLADAGSVVSAEATSLGDAGGLLGELYRVRLGYSTDATGPDTVVIKFPSTDPQQRGVADALGFYKREITFYNEHTKDLPFGVARAYGAVQAQDSTDFVLVMEDVGHLDQIDQVRGASLDQARAAIINIARFHALWWEHADLDQLGETFLPLSAPLYLAALPGVFEGGWPTCQEKQAANLTPDVIEFGDNFGARLPTMLAAIATPQTLVHGDFRGDNLLFDDDDGLVILDFQITGVANGLYDVAYFCCQSIDSDVRHGNDQALIQLYVDTLAAEGIDYSFEEAMSVYRVAVAFCLIYAVTSFQAYEAFDGRQHELMTSMLSRSVRAIIDNDSLSLL